MFDMQQEILRMVSVDVEASGPYAPRYSLLSIGASLIANPQNKFYVEIKPISPNITNSALQVLGQPFVDRCNKRGLDPTAAMIKFQDWLHRIDGKPIFVAFNKSFDFSWCNYYFLEYLGVNPFGINGIDMKDVWYGYKGAIEHEVSWYATLKRRMKHELHLQSPHTHNALDDAIEQAELFRSIIDLMKQSNQRNDLLL